MVTSTHYAARLRFVNPRGESLQSLSRIRPDLQAGDAQLTRQAVNGIRLPEAPVTAGFYTVMDELAEN